MKYAARLWAFGLFAALSAGCAVSGRYPASAEETHPLGEGDRIPSAMVRDIEGTEVDLKEAVAGQPTVLIFYRGGWCPYCNDHFGDLATIESDILSLGARMIAVSPDRPEELRETLDEHKRGYRLLSDSDANAILAFGLAFEVAPSTRFLYRLAFINLEEASGKEHHLLPVPAAYVLDSEGRIAFAYVNADYTERIDPQELLREVRKAAK